MSRISNITCLYRAHRIIRSEFVNERYTIENGEYMIEIDGEVWGYTLAEIERILGELVEYEEIQT